ncbi:F510_1955 family glycosylhydrolase [Nonomuraea sp. NPDC046570]|uniref:F510_1955 family glycosylhydrolase n=1 Tax=Nonomuraea sp. NPDC046570 TaxID=3155255 RepID=UPI0033EFFFA7
MVIKKLGALLLAAAVLTACGTGTPEQRPEKEAADPGVGHIHGLGVDPGTGKVYVAGHYGLFTVEGGKLARVGDRDADHMGFTVAGPGAFYASGHPAAGDIQGGQAPHLGLIRSADAGRTWQQVALAGQADFHALQVAGTVVYGYDSQTGQIWRGSEGGENLRAKARLDLLDLASGTNAPDTVYATTPDGVRVSTDGGASFKPLKGAPLLAFLDVTGADRLVGVAPDGQVHASTDNGATWQPGGRLPMQAVAFTAVSADRLLAASMDGTVYESTNAGKDFTTLHRP